MNTFLRITFYYKETLWLEFQFMTTTLDKNSVYEHWIQFINETWCEFTVWIILNMNSVYEYNFIWIWFMYKTSYDFGSCIRLHMIWWFQAYLLKGLGRTFFFAGSRRSERMRMSEFLMSESVNVCVMSDHACKLISLMHFIYNET